MERRSDLEYIVHKYKTYPISVVYDFDGECACPEERTLLREYWTKAGGGGGDYPFRFATCIKRIVNGKLSLVSCVPRRYPLRLGVGEYKTQGKAANHLNAMRNLWGHVTQVMDANMDAFLGEGFKVRPPLYTPPEACSCSQSLS